MDVKISKIDFDTEEYIDIHCHEVTEDVREIIHFIKSRQGQLSGNMEGKQYEIAVKDIYYIEAIDNKCFLYCSKKVYETKEKLYSLENILEEKNFLRISKSIILNLMKVKAVKPGFNSRFIAILQNGEEVIISRKYVPALKEKLQGKNVNGGNGNER